MKKFLLGILSIPFVFLSVHAQQWQDFTSQSRVKNMHIDGDIAYVATLGGMVRYNLATGQHQLYTKANSGLASDAVEVIKTDDLGTIWIGTYDAGITMYDGQTWTTYNTKNSPLPGNVILTLVIDKNNNKWIGTNKGLVKISSNGWTIYNSTTSPMSDDDVWAMDMDKDGGLWIGCVTGSYLLKDNNWTDFSSQVPMYGVNGMACMPNGEVFNCGVGGVFVYKNGIWTDISANGPDGLRNARKALRGPDGNIWVATDYSGLFKYDGVKWTGGTGSSETQFRDNGTITIDGNGNLFAAGSQGISRYTGKTWEQVYQPVTSLLDNYVKSIASDMAGKIWVAHASSVAMYNGAHWTYYTTDNSIIPYGMVYKVRSDKPGAIWICTSGGLVHKEGDTWKIYTKENAGFTSNEILDVAFDSKGQVWVSHDGGLSSFDGTAWTHYGKPALFDAFERGTVLFADKNDRIWIGSSLGTVASYSQDGSWKYYTENSKSFPGGYVMDFATDNNGKLWAAAWGHNLCYFDGNKWEKLTSASTVSATAIAAGRNGNIWSSSSYPATLTRYVDETATDIFTNDNSPISGRTVNALAIDEKGNLWIGTAYGLVTYSNADVSALPEIENHAMNFSVYPNPSKDRTGVSLELEKPGKVNVRIMDLTGRTLTQESQNTAAGKQMLNIQTSTLVPGTYVLELSQGNIASRQKLVVIP